MDEPSDFIERHAKELKVELAALSWLDVYIKFSTPPEQPFKLPAPITFEGETMGMLKTYDPETGVGLAMVDGKMSVNILIQCKLGEFEFRNFDVLPGLTPKQYGYPNA